VNAVKNLRVPLNAVRSFKIKDDTKMDLNKCSMKVWANLPEHAKQFCVL
jgi:hypothetical protein